MGHVRTLIHEYGTRVRDQDGTDYIGRTYAEERADGTWYGWLEFEPVDWSKATRHTEQETSQPNRAAIEYWAGGLQPVYLEGALRRSRL